MSAESIERGKTPENKEAKLPKLSFDFFFGPHGTVEDAAGLEERFAKADVFIPELFGWSEAALNVYNDLSYGRITPEDAMKLFKKDDFNGFMSAIFKMIYKSYKPIVFADASRETNKKNAINNDEERFKMHFGNTIGFEKKLAEFRQYLKNEAETEKTREEHMISNLYPSLLEALKGRPDLLNQKELKVLLFLGAAHTGVSTRLSSFNQDVTRKFRSSVTLFPYQVEAMRAMAMDRPADNLLVAQSLLERLIAPFIANYADKITKDSQKVIFSVRNVVSEFELEEIRDIFSEQGRFQALSKFLSYVEKKHLQLPINESEMRLKEKRDRN
jgi:hypothetical protein